jgi:hypothetical protein
LAKAAAAAAAAAEEFGLLPDAEKKRCKNYTADEDTLLSMAWVSASVNPEKGNNQTAQTFWEDVEMRYYIKQLEPAFKDNEACKRIRLAAGLMYRFQKYIQKHVIVWNRYYKRAWDTLPSGVPKNFENAMKYALPMYQEGQPKGKFKRGGRFQFEDCVEILHKVPKFDPFFIPPVVDLAAGDDPMESSQHTGTTMGSNMERPIGSKAAKMMQRESDHSTSHHIGKLVKN